MSSSSLTPTMSFCLPCCTRDFGTSLLLLFPLFVCFNKERERGREQREGWRERVRGTIPRSSRQSTEPDAALNPTPLNRN